MTDKSLKIVVWHPKGRLIQDERSLYYLIEINPSDEFDWEVLQTFSDRAAAQKELDIRIDELNEAHPERSSIEDMT